MNYSLIDRYCIALIFDTQKFFTYLLAHCLNLVMKSIPLNYVLSQPTMSESIARWRLELSAFNITIVTPKGLKSQHLSGY